MSEKRRRGIAKVEWAEESRLFTEIEPTVEVIVDSAAKSEEEDELIEPRPSLWSLSARPLETKLSTNSSLAHLFKAFIGTGNLALPYAVADTGLIVAIIGIPACGAMFVYCTHCLISASRLYCKFTGREKMDFGYTLQFAFEYGPKRCQWLSKFAKKFMNTIILLQQIGYLIVFFVFIGVNLQQVININWPVQIYIAMTLPFLIFVNLIRNVEVLALVSGLGIIVKLIGTAIIFVYLLEKFLPVSELVLLADDPLKYPIFFCTLVFAFEGIGVVLPLENKMLEPEEMTSRFGVINIGLSLVTIFYFAITFYGNLRVGQQALGVITLNLPDVPMYSALKVIFSVMTVASYAVQFFVSHEILFGRIRKWIPNERHIDVWDYVVRIFVVVFTAGVAAIFPFIGPFISLVGGFISVPISVTLPVIIDMLRRIPRPEEAGRWYWRLWLDGFLLAISVYAMLVGTIFSVKEIALASDKSKIF